ncbi:hypothetical protein SAMN02910447_01202 [Ruminococcus sp. YE71]|uniref:hypothetical protein n=1 Tax=unclassified Ruminococcus TaxID=2608920 RepID=UPI000887A74B|nr:MULTISPECIES: hypothetical protein [unclassified Ruminococcus]SDA16884.1 hypothetical protein SAMN02910446_01202 [Ruminococcus sp. YE78]SFW25758.1 hypothetical protein SAMN02910447_01202 [Ruminococcus sp. YE71]
MKIRFRKNLEGASVVGVLILLLLIAAAVVVIWLALHGGFGLGKGSGKAEGEGKATESVSVTDSTESADKNNAEPATAEFTELSVVISGDKYLMDGSEYDLEGVIAKIKSYENPNVAISEENGLAENLDQLIERLRTEGISYTDNTAAQSEE